MTQKGEQKNVWLILEDDQALRLALIEMFNLWNKSALPFENGKQAAAWLDEIEAGNFEGPIPELALLDIRLPPGPQGDEIAQRLRSLPQTADMAIVMISAFRFSPDEHAEIERKVRPDLFMKKPFPSMDKFKATLDETLLRVQTQAGQRKKSD